MSRDVIQQSLALALGEYQAQRMEQAEELCRRILVLEPRNAQALHLLGMIALAGEQFDDAVELIQEAISLDETSAEFHGSLGLALATAGRNREAGDRAEARFGGDSFQSGDRAANRGECRGGDGGVSAGDGAQSEISPGV
jgi:Flp pilus assembly protein TadD